MIKALLVIDVQGYFVNNHTQRIPQAIADHIQNSNYDYVLFTRFINTRDSVFATKRNWHGCSEGANVEIASELQPFVKHLFTKNTFSVFQCKEFAEFVKHHNIQHFDLCGLDINACILAAAFELFDRGYGIKVLTSLCGSHNGEQLETAAKKIIKNNFEKYY